MGLVLMRRAPGSSTAPCLSDQRRTAGVTSAVTIAATAAATRIPITLFPLAGQLVADLLGTGWGREGECLGVQRGVRFRVDDGLRQHAVDAEGPHDPLF